MWKDGAVRPILRTVGDLNFEFTAGFGHAGSGVVAGVVQFC